MVLWPIIESCLTEMSCLSYRTWHRRPVEVQEATIINFESSTAASNKLNNLNCKTTVIRPHNTIPASIYILLDTDFTNRYPLVREYWGEGNCYAWTSSISIFLLSSSSSENRFDFNPVIFHYIKEVFTGNLYLCIKVNSIVQCTLQLPVK